MPKRNFERVFLPYTAAVEKKILKLVQFMEENEDDEYVGGFWLTILMAHAKTLRDSVERMAADWDNLREEILQQDFARIEEFVESSMSAAEAVVDEADLFVCRHEDKERRHPETPKTVLYPQFSKSTKDLVCYGQEEYFRGGGRGDETTEGKGVTIDTGVEGLTVSFRNLAPRVGMERTTLVSILSGQQNLMKTYHNEANTGGITKIALKIFLDFFGQSR